MINLWILLVSAIDLCGFGVRKSCTNTFEQHRSGADPERSNGNGQTAADLAERGGHEDVALLLREWATDNLLQ